MTPMNPQGGAQKPKSNSVLIVVLVVGGLFMFCCVGSVAVIAVPNFIKFGARSKQAEAKSNLKGAFTAEKAWFGEKDTYSESLEEIGFAPERGNRYRYILSPSGDGLTQVTHATTPSGERRNSPDTFLARKVCTVRSR